MTMQRTPLLMSRLLDRGAWIAPDEEVVTLTSDGVHRQTCADTRRRAGQLANGLLDLGIAFGDRVASFMWNGWRHLELYQAVPSIGAVLHTLNVRLGASDLEYIVNHAKDRIVFLDADLLPILEPLAPALPCVERFVVCGEPGADRWESSLPNAIDYEDFIGGYGDAIEWPEFDENAPLGLCYTSGTTGNPKGVMYTHRSTYLHTMAEAMTDTLGLGAADCVCPVVPMFHAMGWGLPFAAAMLGAKQVMPHRFTTPAPLAGLIASEGVTISAGVPTIWQGVRALLEAEPDRHDLSALDRLVCGGSAPPLSLIRWYWDVHRIENDPGVGHDRDEPPGDGVAAGREALAPRARRGRAVRERRQGGPPEPRAGDGDRGRGLPARAPRREVARRAAAARAVGLLGVLPRSAAGQVPGRMAGDRRRRRHRSREVPHHRGPLPRTS